MGKPTALETEQSLPDQAWVTIKDKKILTENGSPVTAHQKAENPERYLELSEQQQTEQPGVWGDRPVPTEYR